MKCLRAGLAGSKRCVPRGVRPVILPGVDPARLCAADRKDTEMAEPAIRLVWRKIDELIPYEGNAKQHPQAQLDRLVNSFDEFGRIVPAGIDAAGNLIYGHGRILAARQRGDTEFPCIEIDGLSDLQRRAFVHADNILAESPTDEKVLRGEMEALAAAGFDIRLTGYDPAGLSLGSEDVPEIVEDEYDEAPPKDPRTKRGQLWQLGDHRLLCGDATSADDVQLCAGGGADPSGSHRSPVWDQYRLREQDRRREARHLQRQNWGLCRMPCQ